LRLGRGRGWLVRFSGIKCKTGVDTPQEQRARCLPQPIIREDIAVLPRDGLDARQHRVALLPRRDEDGRARSPRGEGLRGGLYDLGRSAWGRDIVGRGRPVEALWCRLLDAGCLCSRPWLSWCRPRGSWLDIGQRGEDVVGVAVFVVVHRDGKGYGIPCAVCCCWVLVVVGWFSSSNHCRARHRWACQSAFWWATAPSPHKAGCRLGI
jgi:hypothetical protein